MGANNSSALIIHRGNRRIISIGSQIHLRNSSHACVSCGSPSNGVFLHVWFGFVEEFDFYLTREAIKGVILPNVKREPKTTEEENTFCLDCQWLVEKTDNNQV